MGETLRLPKSGVELTSHDGTTDNYMLRVPSVGYIALLIDGDTFTPLFGGMSIAAKSREEAVAWLDARVLELRAALLPPDAEANRAETVAARELAAAVDALHVTDSELACLYPDVQRALARYRAALSASAGGGT